MKRVKVALVAAAAVVAFGPAAAQPPALAPAGPTLPPAEQAALLPVKQAADAGNWAAATALLPAARTAVRSAEGRYALGRLELDWATATNNRPAMADAISMVLQSGQAGNPERAELLRRSASLAYDKGQLNSAQGSLERALELVPDDPETLTMLGQMARVRNNQTQALGFFQRALRAAERTGRVLPESRYRLALSMAEQAGQRGVALEIARQYISAHPSPEAWREVLTVFRTVGTVDPAQDLDAMRLARAAGALTGERDYFALAEALNKAGLPAEAKAVLDEGVAQKMITASEATPKSLLSGATTRANRERSQLAAQVTAAKNMTATATQARTVADTLLAHGRHAEAAELYRLALTRVGEDPGLVNTRLGIALAMAGQRAEAEAAFRAAAGPHSDLAALWAIWLTQRPA